MDPNVEEDNGRRCGCCCCLKYCIFYLLTFLIWIGGVVLLAIGIYYFVGFKHLEDMTGVDLGGIQTVFMWPAIYFIVVGSLRFIACFIGCCGSIKSSTCLLKSFLIVLTVVFIIELIVEISMAVLAFTAQDYIINYVKGFLNPYVEGYEPSSDKTQMIDNIQIALACCGAGGYKDYEKNDIFRCGVNADPSGEYACDVPYSCCINREDRTCGDNMLASSSDASREGIIYTVGCVDSLMNKAHFQNNFLIIGLTLLGIMLVMLFTIIFGFCILRHVSNREGNEGTDVRMDLLKSEREYDA